MPPSPTGIRSFGDYGILQLKFPAPGEDLLLTFSSWANTDSEQARARRRRWWSTASTSATLTYAGAARVDGRIVIPERLVEAPANGMMEIRFDVPRTGPPGTNSEPVTLQLRLEVAAPREAQRSAAATAAEPHIAPHTRPIH